MTHVHKRSGLTFEVGTLDDTDGIHTYDITVITKWDNEEDCIGSGVEIVGFYFGELYGEVLVFGAFGVVFGFSRAECY